MDAFHTEDQVSLCASFDQARVHMLHSRRSAGPFASHEMLSGMDPGELKKRQEDPFNQLNLQSSIEHYFDSQEMIFRPSDDVLKSILAVYELNASCTVLNDRIRLDEIPILCHPVECHLEVDVFRPWDRYTGPIFTMHPHTKEVTSHSYPYTTLPRFKLPSTDPGLLGVAAYIFDHGYYYRRRHHPHDVVHRFGDAWKAGQLRSEHYKEFQERSLTYRPPRKPRGKPVYTYKKKRRAETGLSTAVTAAHLAQIKARVKSYKDM